MGILEQFVQHMLRLFSIVYEKLKYRTSLV